MRDIDVYKAATERARVMLDHDLGSRALDQDLHAVNLDSITAANEPAVGGGEEAAQSRPPSPVGPNAILPSGEWYLTDPTKHLRIQRLAPLAQLHNVPGLVK